MYSDLYNFAEGKELCSLDLKGGGRQGVRFLAESSESRPLSGKRAPQAQRAVRADGLSRGGAVGTDLRPRSCAEMRGPPVSLVAAHGLSRFSGPKQH